MEQLGADPRILCEVGGALSSGRDCTHTRRCEGTLPTPLLPPPVQTHTPRQPLPSMSAAHRAFHVLVQLLLQTSSSSTHHSPKSPFLIHSPRLYGSTTYATSALPSTYHRRRERPSTISKFFPGHPRTSGELGVGRTLHIFPRTPTFFVSGDIDASPSRK